MCIPILIKALSTSIIAIICLIIILVQKNKVSKIETIIGLIIIILCLCFSLKEFYHFANPDIENIIAKLDCYNRPPYRIGYECSFIDTNGENYNLYIDPLTFKKCIEGGELIQNGVLESFKDKKIHYFMKD